MALTVADLFHLGPGRLYVAEHADSLQYIIKVLYHNRATNTCQEKVDLLNETNCSSSWTLDRTIKALYGAIDGVGCGFVLPELETAKRPKIVDAPVVRRVFQEAELNPLYSSKFVSNSEYIPEGMEQGTCTPFVSAQEMEKLEKIFVHDAPYLDHQLVDISFGGKGEAAHKVSLHLPYAAIYDILAEEYSDKVVKVNFFGK